jgi:hypothetical protein
VSGSESIVQIAEQVVQIVGANSYVGVDLSDASVTPADTSKTLLLGAALSQRLGISLSASNGAGDGVTDDTVAVNSYLATFAAGKKWHALALSRRNAGRDRCRGRVGLEVESAAAAVDCARGSGYGSKVLSVIAITVGARNLPDKPWYQDCFNRWRVGQSRHESRLRFLGSSRRQGSGLRPLGSSRDRESPSRPQPPPSETRKSSPIGETGGPSPLPVTGAG